MIVSNYNRPTGYLSSRSKAARHSAFLFTTACQPSGEGYVFSRLSVYRRGSCTGPIPSVTAPSPSPVKSPAHPALAPPPGHVQTCPTWTSLYMKPRPSNMFKLVHYVADPKAGGWHLTGLPSCYCPQQ